MQNVSVRSRGGDKVPLLRRSIVHFLSIESIGVFRNSFAIFETGTYCNLHLLRSRTSCAHHEHVVAIYGGADAFCPLESREHSAPLKRSPPDTFKSRTPDATRKLQPAVSSIATRPRVNLIVIEVLVIVQREPDGWISQ